MEPRPLVDLSEPPELEISTEASNSGITVQVLAFNPWEPDKILMVRNLPEKNAPFIHPKFCDRNGNPIGKPPGWGMAGGGLEPNELELLTSADPACWILTEPDTTDEERLILACGYREFRDESGYDLEIHRGPRDGWAVLEQKDRDTGHRLIVLHGRVPSLVSVRPVVEVNEIDRVDWIDIREPLSELFAGKNPKGKRPLFPYFSHLRKIQLAAKLIDKYSESRHKILDRIHFSWRMVFPLGAGDPRFPIHGFQIPSNHFYPILDFMIQRKMETISLDWLSILYQDLLERLLEREERKLESLATHRVRREEDRDEEEAEETQALRDVLGGEGGRSLDAYLNVCTGSPDSSGDEDYVDTSFEGSKQQIIDRENLVFLWDEWGKETTELWEALKRSREEV